MSSVYQLMGGPFDGALVRPLGVSPTTTPMHIEISMRGLIQAHPHTVYGIEKTGTLDGAGMAVDEYTAVAVYGAVPTDLQYRFVGVKQPQPPARSSGESSN